MKPRRSIYGAAATLALAGIIAATGLGGAGGIGQLTLAAAQSGISGTTTTGSGTSTKSNSESPKLPVTTTTTKPTPTTIKPIVTTTIKPVTTEPPKPTTTTTTTTAAPIAATETLTLSCTSGVLSNSPSVSCAWTQSSSPAFAHYSLLRWTGTGSEPATIPSSTSRTATTFSDRSLAFGTTYTYVVVVYDAKGTVLGYSKKSSITTGSAPTTTTTVPTTQTLSLTCGPALLNNVISASCAWTPSTSSTFASYAVLRWTGTGGEPVTVFTSSSRTSTTWADKGLSVGKTFTYVVVVYDSKGAVLGYSQRVSVIPTSGK